MSKKLSALLTKGAARRLFGRFNPAQLPAKDTVKEWQTSASTHQSDDAMYDDDVHRDARDSIPAATGGHRLRALNKLAASTVSRRHPETGNRQFLMFRGIGADEAHVVSGPHIHHTEKSSWTPNLGVAQSFQSDYGENQGAEGSRTIAAWIDEDKIHSAPHMYGSLGEHYGEIPDQPDMDNEYRSEHEIIVHPHVSDRATHAEVKHYQAHVQPSRARIAGTRDVNARINYRGQVAGKNGAGGLAAYTKPIPQHALAAAGIAKKPKKLAASELEKGVKRRLFPVKEEQAQHRAVFGKPLNDRLFAWQKLARPEHRQALDNEIGQLPPNTGKRAAISLVGKTAHRKNPKTGELEFLLHRGIDHKERAQAIDVPSASTAHGSHTSWTPDLGIARDFHTLRNTKLDRPGGLVSAWIPHSAIATVPKHFGDYEHDKGAGPNKYRDEYEVVVRPGNYDLVHNSEIPKLLGQDKHSGKGAFSLDQAINLRAEPNVDRKGVAETYASTRGKLAASELLTKGAARRAALSRSETPKMHKAELKKSTLPLQKPHGNMDLEVQLMTKGKVRETLVGMGIGAAMMLAPTQAAHEPAPPTMERPAPAQDPKKERHLQAISLVESSGGKNTNHARLGGMHAGTRAFGSYGLTPVIIQETAKLNPDLGHEELVQLPKEQVEAYMQQNPDLEHAIASKHYDRLAHHFGQDIAKIGYAWLQGISGAKRAISQNKDIKSHWHVKKVVAANDRLKQQPK